MFMKRLIVLIIAIVLCLSGCSALSLLSDVLADTNVKITDPAKYGEADERAPFPDYFPTSVDDYTVNSYSYTVLGGDPRHEVFLDITVTQEQFDDLLSKVKAYDESYYQTRAYYADGYYEIVFEDHTSDITDYPVNRSGKKADYISTFTSIQKVVYNPETLNMVYVDFIIYDAYPINEIEYFSRFDIDWETYRWYMDYVICSVPCDKGLEWGCPTYREGLYDYIEYDGTVYYQIDDKYIDDVSVIGEVYDSTVIMHDDDLVYDYSIECDVYILGYNMVRHSDHIYTAYGITGDDEHNYLYFDNLYYTKDPELASDYYTSPEFLNKFKKDEVRIGE